MAHRTVVVRVDERPLAISRVPVGAQGRKAAVERRIALGFLDLEPPPHRRPLLILVNVPILHITIVSAERRHAATYRSSDTLQNMLTVEQVRT